MGKTATIMVMTTGSGLIPSKKFVRRALNLVDSGGSRSAIARDPPGLVNEWNCLLGAIFRAIAIHYAYITILKSIYPFTLVNSG